MCVLKHDSLKVVMSCTSFFFVVVMSYFIMTYIFVPSCGFSCSSFDDIFLITTIMFTFLFLCSLPDSLEMFYFTFFTVCFNISQFYFEDCSKVVQRMQYHASSVEAVDFAFGNGTFLFLKTK